MALQASGAITLAQIAAEFGGAAPHAISEYYRGGIYVPDTAANAGVPTSGQIKASDFYGAAASIVFTVTEATKQLTSAGAINYYGYVAANKYIDTNSNTFLTSAAMGARSPTTLYGATVEGLYYASGNPSDVGVWFVVVLSGIRAKSFWTEAVIQGIGTVQSANASFWTGSSSSVWKFDYLANGYGAYGGWDGTGTRTVTIT